MGWDKERSEKRVKSNDFSDLDVNVKDLTRSMDLQNLATKDVRRAEGIHLYVDVPNFHLAVSDAGDDLQKQRKVIRAADVLRRIQGQLMLNDDVIDIQRQTVRAHGLVAKPYDGTNTKKEADRAKQAVIHAITQNTYVLDVFNSEFDDVRNFDSSVGLADGSSLICNLGKAGKRELISLGNCANVAAKIISGRDTIVITESMFVLLPSSLQEHFEKSDEVAGHLTYKATGLRWSKNADLADELKVDWDEEYWHSETKSHRKELLLDKITITDATKLIDVSKLTAKNSKRTQAVAFYADLDGFTQYVQEAETDDKVKSLVRQFHMIRSEFHSVVESDFDGLVLQHRGDCILGIVHLPVGQSNHDSRCQDAVDVAIGIQSSMEDVLNEHLGDRKDIHVAVGVDVGKVIVTRLGAQGQRITMCFGRESTEAERLQRISAAKQIRISADIYDELDDDDLRDEFTKSGKAYVATGLTFGKLDVKQEESAAKANQLRAEARNGRIRVTTKASDATERSVATKPWRKTGVSTNPANTDNEIKSERS